MVLHTALQWQWQNIDQTLKFTTALTGKLWGACCEDIGETWQHYNSTAVYFQWFLMGDKDLLILHCHYHGCWCRTRPSASLYWPSSPKMFQAPEGLTLEAIFPYTLELRWFSKQQQYLQYLRRRYYNCMLSHQFADIDLSLVDARISVPAILTF